MKQLLNNLSNTISEDFKISFTSGQLIINEEDSKCKKVVLKSKKKQIFAFSLDKSLKKPCKVFTYLNQSTPTITKANDGIIFYIYNGEIFILLIELKSKHLNDYKKQLQAGKNFVLYLLNILNNSFEKNYTIKEDNIKCVVFSLRQTARKQGTSRKIIKYEEVNGMNIAELQCNDSHYIEKFFY